MEYSYKETESRLASWDTVVDWAKSNKAGLSHSSFPEAAWRDPKHSLPALNTLGQLLQMSYGETETEDEFAMVKYHALL